MAEERRWDEWLSHYPVKKDIGSARKKGIWLEEALDVLIFLGAKCVDSFFGESSYVERYYEGPDFRAAWAEHGLSVPSLVVACPDMQTYNRLRKELRMRNLVR